MRAHCFVPCEIPKLRLLIPAFRITAFLLKVLGPSLQSANPLS